MRTPFQNLPFSCYPNQIPVGCQHDVMLYSGEFSYTGRWRHLVQNKKTVQEQVTDILKVCLRFLHKFSYVIKFRTLSTMYESVRKLIPYEYIPLYSIMQLF